MSTTVNDLYKNGISLYQMRLIAGGDGLNNLVEWVHIIEDAEVGSFLHGGELVFTAGILAESDEYLMEFVKSVYEANASAFVINTGRYLQDITEEVIAYCNEKSLPLFTIPWKSRMVDMTRDFCQRIIHNEHMEESIATAMKNIIFKTGDKENDISQMVRYGYKRESSYNFMCINCYRGSDTLDEARREVINHTIERAVRSINDNYLSFQYDGYRIVLLMDYEDEEVEKLADLLTKDVAIRSRLGEVQLGIGVSSVGFDMLDDVFSQCVWAARLAVARQESVLYYANLDVYKILMAVGDNRVLVDYYDTMLGAIENYDAENNSNLYEILKYYLENNGSPQLVSEKLYLHRNTVNNQLKKIEKLTGYNPMDLEDKVKLYLAYYIKDLIV